MKLEEAIKERQKVIEVQEKLYKEASTNESKEIIKSATDNDRQLAEWLRELKDLREENKVLISECDRLIKEKGELLKKLEQIAEYKRLLKSAVEGFEYIKPYISGCDGHCKNCPFENEGWCRIDWKYADEALKLIGDERNEP